MDGIGFLVAIASFIMSIVALNKFAKIDTRIAQLKLQLGQLTDELNRLKSGTPISPPPEAPPAEEATAVPPPEQPIIAEAAANTNVEAPPPEAPAAAVESAASKPTRSRDMESTIASRWFVWIGGIAIAIGGLLFVKYAYDNGLISPTTQIVLGLLAAAVLVGAGEFLRRRDPVHAPDNYVPAALSAAGIATAFAAIYAAYALYALVGPTTAFAGLALVGLGAMALSRLQGPFIAALGLIGSYATPALVSTDHPSALGFFPYLAVILGASLFTLRGKSWWWLGYAAIAGSLLWAVAWMGGPYVVEDTAITGIFALVIGVAAVFGLRGRAILGEDSGGLPPQQQFTHPLAIALVGLAAQYVILFSLLHASHHAGVALVMFFVGLALMLALAWLKRRLSLLAPIVPILGLVAMMAWKEVAFHEFAMDERGFWSSVIGGDAPRFLHWMLGAALAFTAVGLAGVRLRAERWAWALLAGLGSVLFVIGAWGRVDALLAQTSWELLAAGLALALLATAYLTQATEDAINCAGGILAGAAAILLVFAIDRLFDNVWMTLGVAALAIVYAVASRLLRSWLMGPITAALGSFVTLRLFVSRELWQDDRTLPLGQHWPLYGYGLPAILFLAASRQLKQAGHERSAVALEGLSLGLIISLISLELRVLIAGGVIYEEPQFLEMAAHILTWAGAAYGLMYRQQLFSSFISLWGSRCLLALSVAGMLIFTLTSLNPVVTEAAVPGNSVFNALLLAYLAPVPLLGLIARKLAAIGWEKLRPAAGLLALLLAFVYVTLETKRVFQGHVMVAWSLTDAENYAYSLVWLGFAVALFLAGIRLAQQYVRYAGLGVMVLVVLKVFLWDMSNLEGLYRIASFVGLGLCLVGIGWLYQRFVHKTVVEKT